MVEKKIRISIDEYIDKYCVHPKGWHNKGRHYKKVSFEEISNK